MKVAILTSALCIFSSLVSSRAVSAAEADVSVIKARAVTATILPSLIVLIKEEWPNTAFGQSNTAEVFRANGAENVQSLIQYKFPDGYSGKSCHFAFANPTTASGSKKVQLFTVSGLITTAATFNSRPSRNQYEGTLNAVLGTWDEASPPTWPCPHSATTLNYETVPQGDNDHVAWSSPNGLVIEVY